MFKKTILIAMLCVFGVSCAYYIIPNNRFDPDYDFYWTRKPYVKESLVTNFFYNNVIDWRARESACLKDILKYFETEKLEKLKDDLGKIKSDIERLEAISDWVFFNTIYEDDFFFYGAIDYIASSCETLNYGRGDCDDDAVLIFRMIQHFSGTFDDPTIVERAGIILITLYGIPRHYAAVVYTKDSDDFLILDREHYAFPTVASVYFSNYLEYTPVIFFNMAEFSIYKPRETGGAPQR